MTGADTPPGRLFHDSSGGLPTRVNHADSECCVSRAVIIDALVIETPPTTNCSEYVRSRSSNSMMPVRSVS